MKTSQISSIHRPQKSHVFLQRIFKSYMIKKEKQKTKQIETLRIQFERSINRIKENIDHYHVAVCW